MNVRFGVPHFPETAVRLTVSLFSLVMAYGYLKLTNWGYWTMIAYSMVFLWVSLNQIAHYNSQPFIGNALFSLLVLLYTLKKRAVFLNSELV